MPTPPWTTPNVCRNPIPSSGYAECKTVFQAAAFRLTSAAFSVQARMTNGAGIPAIKTQMSTNHVHGSSPWRRTNSIEATRTTIPSTTPAAQLATRLVPAGSRGFERAGSLEHPAMGPSNPCQLECDAGEVTIFSHGARQPGALAGRIAATDYSARLSCAGFRHPVAYGGDR